MAKKIRAVEQTYLDEEAKKTFKAWHPQVKFQGRWCFLPDDSSRTKLKESKDETAALEMALMAIWELEEKMGSGR